MSAKTIEIIERLRNLTLSETSELVKQIEKTFKVDVSTKRVISVIPNKKEAKEFVESVPKGVNSGIALEAAEDIKRQIEAVGGRVSLK